MAIFRNGQTRSKTVVAATSVGGGVSGVWTALDLADARPKMYLIEHSPCPGRRVSQLGFMFPRHAGVLRRGASDHGYGCTRPSFFPAHIHHNHHLNIEIHTNPRVIKRRGRTRPLQPGQARVPREASPRLRRCAHSTSSSLCHQDAAGAQARIQPESIEVSSGMRDEGFRGRCLTQGEEELCTCCTSS